MNWEEAIDIEALANWMDDQGLSSGKITNAQLLTGGTQNYLLKFTRAGRDFVLRRPPKHLRANSNETMLREARVLRAIKDSKVPHPGFIASCADQTVIGACFYLMEPVEGFCLPLGMPDYHKSDPAIRRRMGFAHMDAIVELGSLDYKAIGLEGFGNPEGFIERQVPRWLSQLESYSKMAGWPGPADLPGIEALPKWLDDNRPNDSRPGIFHGDFHLANVLFQMDSPELAAAVDWELSTIGDPLMDLGWTMATWPDPDGTTTTSFGIQPWEGFPTIVEMISYYDERSERSLSSIAWYGVLSCFKLGVILEGTYARACAGKAPKETGDRLHQATINLFNRGLKIIANS